MITCLNLIVIHRQTINCVFLTPLRAIFKLNNIHTSYITINYTKTYIYLSEFLLRITISINTIRYEFQAHYYQNGRQIEFYLCFIAVFITCAEQLHIGWSWVYFQCWCREKKNSCLVNIHTLYLMLLLLLWRECVVGTF